MCASECVHLCTVHVLWCNELVSYQISANESVMINW